MDIPLLLRGFVAGALAVPTFHQVALLLLHLTGVSPATPWPVAAVPPMGVPAIISASFWGGVWGVVLVAAAPRVARSPGLAALFGAVLPTLVFWLVVAPLKGIPLAAGAAWPGVVIGPIVNGAWGLGASLILAAIERASGHATRPA